MRRASHHAKPDLAVVSPRPELLIPQPKESTMTLPILRRALPLAAILVALAVAGCSSAAPTAAPSDGPAVSEPARTGPVEGEPAGEASSVTGSFSQKLVYPDGVAVEVVRIKHAKLSANGVGDKGQKAGALIQILSIRVTNGSKTAIQVDAASGTMTYGPDGQEASAVFDSGIDTMSGKVLPGKAKTGTYGYAVPAKYLSDVQLEWGFDYDHPAAIFTGSIR